MKLLVLYDANLVANEPAVVVWSDSRSVLAKQKLRVFRGLEPQASGVTMTIFRCGVKRTPRVTLRDLRCLVRAPMI